MRFALKLLWCVQSLGFLAAILLDELARESNAVRAEVSLVYFNCCGSWQLFCVINLLARSFPLGKSSDVLLRVCAVRYL